MCASPMLYAGIARTVYGVKYPLKPVLKNPAKLERGVMAEACGAILSRFFAERR